MSIFKVRAVPLGLMAVMLACLTFAATASAEAGPFWHHREVGGEGEGAKIEEKSPEQLTGEAKEASLSANIAGTEVEFSFTILLKSRIYNGALQGQIKTLYDFSNISILKPALKGCEVKFGSANTVVLKGHLAWKWNGEKKQLEEVPQLNQTPDIIYTYYEPTQQKPFVEKVVFETGTLWTITLSGSGCGVLLGTFPVSGGDVGIPNIGVGTFTTKLGVRTPPAQSYLQHFWDGTAYQGILLHLLFGGEIAHFSAQTESKAEKQEIAIFEK
jgi:hypothetical protein